jgi:hypothetical protein
LFELLSGALATAPALWIVAPAGSGKTTLVGSYLRHKNQRFALCRLDTHDQDPETLFDTLFSAAHVPAQERTPFPGFGLSVPAIFSRLVWRHILPASGTLVLEDEHSLGDDPSIVGVVEQGVIEAGALGARLVVTSRRPPPRNLDTQHAAGLLCVIGGDSLRFSESEVRQWIQLKQGNALHAHARRLMQLSGGWAVCLGLLLEHLQLGGELPSLDEGAPDTLVDYLVSEVLVRLPEVERECLLWCALLPRTSIGRIKELAGTTNPSPTLARLEALHLLTRDNDGPLPYVHPILATACLRLGLATYGQGEWNQRVERVATLLNREGETDAAFNLFQRSANPQRAARWIVDHALELVGTRRVGTLLSWLRLLPEAERSGDPWLRYFWDALTYFESDRVSRLKDHHFGFRERGDLIGIYVSWCLVAQDLMADYFIRDLRAWLDDLQTLEELHPLAAMPELAARVHHAGAFGRFIAHPEVPDLPTLRQLVIDSAQDAEDWGGPAVALTMVFWQAYGHRSKSDTDALAAAFSNLVTEAPKHQLLKLALSIGSGQLAWESGNLLECDRYWEIALGLSRDLGLPQMIDALNCTRAGRGVDEGLLSEASERLIQTQTPGIPGWRWASNLRELVLIWLKCRAGNAQHAHAHLQAAERYAQASGGEVAIAFAAMLAAQLALALGQANEAGARVERCLEELNDRAPMLRSSVGVIATVIASRTGRIDDARRLARGTLSVIAESGWYVVSASSRDQQAEFCAFALEHSVLPEVTRELIRRRRYTPPPGTDPEAWPWPLKVFTWGRLRLMAGGTEHPLPRGKSRELFCALLALGGRGIAVSKLADALWPDADGDRARRSFDTTLHRLRHALPDPEMLELRDQCLSLSESLCWFDLRSPSTSQFVRVSDAPAGRAGELGTEPRLLEGEPETPWLLAARRRWKAIPFDAVRASRAP